jgi:hypothetical protein
MENDTSRSCCTQRQLGMCCSVGVQWRYVPFVAAQMIAVYTCIRVWMDALLLMSLLRLLCCTNLRFTSTQPITEAEVRLSCGCVNVATSFATYFC